jgi:uncharacterized protein (TIGR02301 family)
MHCKRLPLILLLFALSGAPALAVDPPYQQEMERLAEVMGSLYFLDPLCEGSDTDWRAQMQDLIVADEPDEDRRERLAGAFNSGYAAYSRFYRSCTSSAHEALGRLLEEAQQTARDIHAHYAD